MDKVAHPNNDFIETHTGESPERNNLLSPYHTECIRAAVAMILHQGIDGLEVLFIQRAANSRDPWSGHIAFPGGKLEVGELERSAACRETLEEIGIDLANERYVGRLSDIVGANLPVRVSCCLFMVDRSRSKHILNEEVSDLFWVSLSDLQDTRRHLQSRVDFGEKQFEVQAIKLPIDNKPVLWGITYRLVMQFLSIVENDKVYWHNNGVFPQTIEIDEEIINAERQL
jgi:8-oxo-dGTP pyrophosphatase MutT (NUDIX family)